MKHVTKELVPALREALAQALPAHEVALEVSDDAEKLWLYYTSAVENTGAYLRPSVLIEFGGRNATLPQDSVTIVPDVAAHVPSLVFPGAIVLTSASAQSDCLGTGTTWRVWPITLSSVCPHWRGKSTVKDELQLAPDRWTLVGRPWKSVDSPAAEGKK